MNWGGSDFVVQIKSSVMSFEYDYTSASMVKHNGELGSLATPVRDGYTFVGWFTEATGGTQVTEDTIITDDIVLYAHWREN